MILYGSRRAVGLNHKSIAKALIVECHLQKKRKYSPKIQVVVGMERLILNELKVKIYFLRSART